MFIGELFGPDLLIVVIIGAVLLFGGAAIPKLARSLGQTKSEFEKGMRSAKDPNETINNPTVASGTNVENDSFT